MELDEALRLLKGGEQGIAEWNRRRASGQVIPDLSGVDLSRALLRQANLREAVLRRAVLREADLREVDLTDANLDSTDLTNANLRGADLIGADLPATFLLGADLSGAYLGGAKLFGTYLLGADLSRADLREADLFHVSFGATILATIDLSRTKGLESATHDGPSTISTDTLFLSHGKIPETFLRGCGVPDVLIANIPALVGAIAPIQFYSCFISYSAQDEKFAKRLHSRMVQEGMRVWFAPEDMRGGRKSRDQIEGAIRVHDKLLLVLSGASMGSDWVEHELRTALRREAQEKRQVLFPIKLAPWESIKQWECFDSDTGRDMARQVREYHIPDFSKWKDDDAFEAAFANLLRDLKAEASAARAPGDS